MGLSWLHELKNDSGFNGLMVKKLYKDKDKYVVREMAKDYTDVEIV